MYHVNLFKSIIDKDWETFPVKRENIPADKLHDVIKYKIFRDFGFPILHLPGVIEAIHVIGKYGIDEMHVLTNNLQCLDIGNHIFLSVTECVNRYLPAFCEILGKKYPPNLNECISHLQNCASRNFNAPPEETKQWILNFYRQKNIK